MSIIVCIVYGLLSGITEFFPISARAHQSFMLHLSGKTARDPLQDLLVHMAVLFSILVFNRTTLAKMRRERSQRSRGRNGRIHVPKAAYDSRLIRTATVPLVIGSFLYTGTLQFEWKLLVLALFLILNGAILLIVEHMRHGNRDASTLSGLDGVLMGIGGALASFPGLSRTGMITAYCVGRGADRQKAANWAVMLGIPAMAVVIVLDVIALITSGAAVASFATVVGYVLGGGAAFGGAYVGMTFLKIVLNRSGFSSFAYYSLGAALFSVILYLITW